MQAELGSKVNGQSTRVHYVYVARYEYTDVVVQNDNFFRLTAYADQYQAPGLSQITTFPAGTPVTYPDLLGNQVHRVRISAPHEELVIAAVGQVDLAEPELNVGDVPLWSSVVGVDDAEFLTPTQLVDPGSVAQAALRVVGGTGTMFGAVEAIVSWVTDEVKYERGHTSVTTTAADVLAQMRGVCQDKAHLALGMIRSMGIPARYVSGLLTRQPGETHAWLEFLHPEAGWLPADPTKGFVLNTGSNYLKFAVGRDYSEVPPVSGSFVSKGYGLLDFATAKVFFDRDTISVPDALALMEEKAG